VSDERCGPWVYASARRRSRECRSWHMTDEELALRREEDEARTRALAAWGIPVFRQEPSVLSIHDFDAFFHDLWRDREWRYVRGFEQERISTPFTSPAWIRPTPHAERIPISEDVNERARKLIDSALEGLEHP
jgi:hypothetical protein